MPLGCGIFPPHQFTGKRSLSEDTIPTQIGSLYNAAQRFSQIGRDEMPVIQFVFRYNKFAVGIKYNKIRIVARRDPAFARLATGEPRRALSHPVDQIDQLESSSAGFGPHQRQRYGETGNPAPRSLETTLNEPLHRWRTRRMVRYHHVNRSIFKSLP